MCDSAPLDVPAGAAIRRAGARRLRRMAALLLLLVGALTALAVAGGVPYAGLAALALTFGGGAWLLRRWAAVLRGSGPRG